MTAMHWAAKHGNSEVWMGECAVRQTGTGPAGVDLSRG